MNETVSYMGVEWNLLYIREREDGVMMYGLESDDELIRFEISKKELDENP